VATDFATWQNLRTGQDGGIVADLAVVADGDARVNVDVFAALRGWTDDRPGADSNRVANSLRTKMRYDPAERGVDVGYDDDRTAGRRGTSLGQIRCNVLTDHNGTGLRGVESLDSINVIDQRDLAGCDVS